MSDIFISYAEEDSGLALKISEQLESSGYSTWMFERDQLPSVAHFVQTGQNIASCKAFLLICSKISATSTHIKREIEIAINKGKSLYPVLIDITYAELQRFHPHFEYAIGACVPISVDPKDVKSIIPKLLASLRLQDVEPLNSNLEKTQSSQRQSNAEAEMSERLLPDNVAKSLRDGDSLVKTGDLYGAFKAYNEALCLAERLVLVSYGSIGDVLKTRGNLEAALEKHSAAMAIARRLTAVDLTNTEWQRDLSVSHEKLGNILTAKGDLEGALREYKASLEIRKRLAQADPTNASWQRDLSVSHNKIGDVLTAKGDLEGALREYKASLIIAERLAQDDPTNASWQRDLSVSHEKIGDVLTAKGDLEGALREYKASFDIAERLTKLDPTNTLWQRHISISHNKIGDVLTAKGDLEGALREYKASLIIAERLAQDDPTNAEWQRDLYVSHYRLASVHKQNRLGVEEKREWGLCLEVLHRMKASGMYLDSQMAQHMEQLENML